MANQYRFSRGVLPALTLALLLAACGGDKPEALLASARDYLAKDDAKAAVIQIKNALQKAPESGEARLLLGQALLKSGDPVGAEVELRKAMDVGYAPDQVVPQLAQALLAIGQPKKVLSDLQTAPLTTAEAKADLQTSVALAHAALGQMDKARAAIDAALAVKADHGQTMLVKARMLLADGDIAGGTDTLEKVLAKDARNHEAWKLKGDLLGLRKDAEGALAAYRKAVEAKPDFGIAHAAIVESLIRQNKLDDAGAQLEAMKKALPRNPQTAMVEAEYLYQKMDFKKALESVQAVLGVAPNHPKALLLAGATQFQLNAFPQAEDYLTKALKQAPGTAMARRMLAVIHLRSAQPAKALADIEPMLEDGQDDAALMSLAGDIYMQNGNPQKAEEYFAKAVTLDPKNPVKQTKVALSTLPAARANRRSANWNASPRPTAALPPTWP